jgi:hypothetical protein
MQTAMRAASGDRQASVPVSVRIFDDGGATIASAVDDSRESERAGVSGTWRAPDLRLLIDRRRSPRKVVKGDAMAVFATGKGAGTLARVRLVDASWVGLGLASPIAVEPGTSVSIIPEDAMSPRQVGIVVRCEKGEDTGEGGQDEYRVGVRCRAAKGAA